MAIGIRLAAPGDVPGIDALLVGSFPAPAEATLVRELCVAGDMVLMMVAVDETNDRVIGAVAFSRMAVEAGGKDVPSVAMAPVAVERSYRGHGVAEALIQTGLEQLEKAGVVLCFVLGAPAFYGRFGFDPMLAQGYESPYAGEYFMAAPLQGGLAPCGVRGKAEHAPAFATLG